MSFHIFIELTPTYRYILLLARMIFETHIPSTLISPYVESIFHYQGFMPDHSIERVVPTGHIFILFELDGFARSTFDNDTLEENATFSKVWISGMHQNYISISAHENSEMFVIQFKPHGSHPFTHVEAESLNEKVIPIEAVMGGTLLTLRERMLNTDSSYEKFSLAETWLLDRFDKSRTPPVSLISFIDKLQGQPASKLKSLIKSHSNTQKHLIDQFKKYVGLTPKYYQRILRFNDLMLKIQEKRLVSWSEIAYECGYSDQSHFIREFQKFSGFNPSEFINGGFDEGTTNFFPMDREG